jgi:hypothetical protein
MNVHVRTQFTALALAVRSAPIHAGVYEGLAEAGIRPDWVSPVGSLSVALDVHQHSSGF